MDITFLGHASFRLKGKNAICVIDPFDSQSVGLKFPRGVEANVVTLSHDHKDHNAKEAVLGSPYIITGPGEYEVKGISIIGIGSYHDNQNGALHGKNVIFRYVIDGVHVAHLGDLGHQLTTADLDMLSGTDVLMVSVSGKYLTNKETIELIGKIEPKIVLPMHYKQTGHAKSFESLPEVGVFLSEFGKEAQRAPKLSVTKDKLPQELQVIVLE